MNKIFYSFAIFIFASLPSFISAQHCQSASGSFVCTATGGPSGGGFENPDSIPCIIQGVPYDTTIQLTMFSMFFAAGANQVVDSIQFVSIENLPCGMCWSSNNANDRFAAGENGCIRISGTSADSSGQYKLSLTLTAWINGVPTGLTVYPLTVDASGIKMYLRVQSQSGTCAPTDTSSSFVGLTANCTTSINDLNSLVRDFSIYPNPINSSATLSFTAEREARYTVKITNVTGRLVSTEEVAAMPGRNKITIERGAKPAGVYFVSLSSRNYCSTNRFTIVE